MDKFSELVDGNMETLRKAIAESREVYVSIINKSNVESEERFNEVVDDIDKVASTLHDLQGRLASTDLGTGEEVQKLARQLNDLEANLNTQIITEKSLRKAQDKELAQELDKISKKNAMLSSGDPAFD